MFSVRTWLLMKVCPALLPPVDPNERDYYDLLGLPASSTWSSHSFTSWIPRRGGRKNNSDRNWDEEIRRAYRKKSLELHPDKLKQRGLEPTEQQAQEYLQVQEAYQVLSDPKQRQAYHQLGQSPARYRFVMTEGGLLGHPYQLWENLGQSSWPDKTRLVLLVTVGLGLVLLQPILICAKVNAVVDVDQNHHSSTTLQDAPWTDILIPYWIFQGCSLLLWTGVLIFIAEAREQVLPTWLEQMGWLVGVILLARIWDKDMSVHSWHTIAIPFYAIVVFQIWGLVQVIQSMQQEQGRMVSPEYLEQRLLSDPALQELEEEERMERLAELYTVITPQEHMVAQVVEARRQAEVLTSTMMPLNEMELEHIRVQSSPEYRSYADLIQQAREAISTKVMVYITLIALIAAKLQNQISASWWLVFLPLWIHWGWTLLGACSTCCFLGVLLGGADGSIQVVTEHTTSTMPPADVASPETAAGQNGSPSDNNNTNHVVSKTNDTNAREETHDIEKGTDGDGCATVYPVGPIETGEASLASGIGPSDDDHVRDSSTIFAPAQADFLDQRTVLQSSNSRDTVEVATNNNAGPGKESETQADSNNGNSKSSTNNILPADADKEGGPDGVHIDEETFRAWQSAFEAVEQNVAERQAKAQLSMCLACFQVMLLCLIVGKLEQDYKNVNWPNDTGYNAFWILFPVFVVTGIVLCCCSCLIYTAGTIRVEDVDDNDDQVAAAHPDEAASDTEGPTRTGVDLESPDGLSPVVADVVDSSASAASTFVMSDPHTGTETSSIVTPSTAQPTAGSINDLD